MDFLGLRQVNIDMMSGVLPGINNVTWWIRPFSVLSWIYWKFYEIASQQKISNPSGEQLRVWKEKVETLFTWSHKLEGLQGLPGISCEFPASVRDTGYPVLSSSVRRRAVGDLFMSLIHTCELDGVNPFDLTELLRHGEELKHRPSEWMP